MNRSLMFMAVGLVTIIGAGTPLLFGDEFPSIWILVGAVVGAGVGVAIHFAVRKTGYID